MQQGSDTRHCLPAEVPLQRCSSVSETGAPRRTWQSNNSPCWGKSILPVKALPVTRRAAAAAGKKKWRLGSKVAKSCESVVQLHILFLEVWQDRTDSKASQQSTATALRLDPQNSLQKGDTVQSRTTTGSFYMKHNIKSYLFFFINQANCGWNPQSNNISE